jgi:hypothetical protein
VNPSPSAQFDLGRVADRLDPLLTKRRRILDGMVAFLSILGALILALKEPEIVAGSLSFWGWVGLWTILGGSIGGSVAILVLLHRLRRSARRLRMDATGFDLYYPDGAIVRTQWTDPRLKFDLVDMSHVNPSKLLSGVPHSITVRGVNSQLTPEAYFSILAEVTGRGLEDTTNQGSRWVFDSDAVPIIHRIHPPASKPATSTRTPPQMGQG